MHGALHGTPCALESGRDIGLAPSSPGMRSCDLDSAHAGVVFPSCDREADPRDVPVTVRSMRPRRSLDLSSADGVVDRPAETAAFLSPREG